MILAIYGGGGLGREVLELAKQINQMQFRWEQIIFVDDVISDNVINGSPKYSFDNFSKKYSSDDVRFTIALGEPKLRKKLCDKVIEHGYNLDTLIYPNVHIPETSSIGNGVVINANCVISCNAEICDNVFLQPFCVVGHDSKVGASCVCSAYSLICGNCIIGQETYIAVHASIKEKCTIGSDCIVGMGSMVFRDVPDGMIVLGNPARALKTNDEGKVFK